MSAPLPLPLSHCSAVLSSHMNYCLYIHVRCIYVVEILLHIRRRAFKYSR